MLFKLDTILKASEKVGRTVEDISNSDRLAETKATIAGLRASIRTAYDIGRAEAKLDIDHETGQRTTTIIRDPVQQEFDFEDDNELS